MSDDLVKRLREITELRSLPDYQWKQWALVAAQRIEALGAQNLKMREALEEIAGNGDGTGRNPQLMVDAAGYALSKAKSQQEGETE